MDTQEPIDAVAAKTGSTEAQTAGTLDALIGIVTTAVTKDGTAMNGFGSFPTGQRAARTGRNPATGAEIQIKRARS
ncbi:HU family DNA-binding protein [Paraburkholderia strydomiana]